MKKIININFQGRVVPIEETAYELLKNYIESLRRYFANEEGRDEIINDIESRIAELFSERLKKGATCIADEDVNAVISSMGRPEDFDPLDADSTAGNAQYQQNYSNSTLNSKANTNYGRGRFYRNADDKILGGVCSGLANYLGIDPVVMRIIFVLLSGALFWVYILLWIIVPSQSIQSNVTKRLFRNADDKVIAGVAGGLSAYFNIASWIPRLIFVLPLLLTLISGTFHNIFWNWDFHFIPRILSGSLSSTLFVVYIILWIAVPFATTAAEKLEMRGERVDLNSIRNTVKEDFSSFKTKAEAWTGEVKETAANFSERAKTFGQQAGSQARNFAAEAAPVARRTSSGLGHVIGILFKAFFMFVAAVIALSLFAVLTAILFGGVAVLPLKDFFLADGSETWLAWVALILFLGIPCIALITWLIRRIMSVRSRNHYLGYVFASLWFIGLVSMVVLAASFTRKFRTRSGIEENIMLATPTVHKMMVDVNSSNVHYYTGDWFNNGFDNDFPIYGVNEDTLFLNTVRINVEKSKDSVFHVMRVKTSRGNTQETARDLAGRIRFAIDQQDSTLYLDRGFAISKNDKFRNQQVIIVIQVPVGKKIQLSSAVDSYSWFNVNVNNHRGWNVSNDYENYRNSYSIDVNQEYTMTPDGPEKTANLDQSELKNGHFKLRIDANGGHINIQGDLKDNGKQKDDDDNNDDDNRNNDNNDNRYRYRSTDSIKTAPAPKKTVSVQISEPVIDTDDSGRFERLTSSFSGLISPLTALTEVF